jgi:hypothetical protein
MFDKEYSFRGSHAEKVIKLTAVFDNNKNKLFNRNLDVYLIAPIVGFLYNRKADLDRSGESTKIFPEQLMNERNNLLFTYRLIILLDKEHEPDFEGRINNAFRYYGSEKAASDEELYEAYVRGGVDVLYEKLLGSIASEEDYLKNLYDFLEEFDERYNQAVTTDSILDLCRLARS